MFQRFGIATAMGWIIGFILMGFTVYQMKRLSNMAFKTAESLGGLMSIFLKSERKDPKVIFLLIIIYFILSAGALTMVYPFLLMISGSLKGKLDAYEFDVIPKFLVNDEVLFKRYVEHKYNEKIDEYQIANKEFVRIFKSAKPPQNLNDVIIKVGCNLKIVQIYPLDFSM